MQPACNDEAIYILASKWQKWLQQENVNRTFISFTIIQVFWPMSGTPAESEGIWLRCKMHNEKKK